MVQTRKTAPAVPVDAVTPTRRSTRTKAVPVDAVTPRRCSTRTKAVRDSTKTLTPGQRFRDLLTVCEDHVPVADVVGDDCPVDNDVIVSPPPNKQTRNNQVVGEHNDSTITPVPPAFASVAATSLTQLEDDDPSDTAKDVNDDDKDGDDDRKLPAKRKAGKGDAMPSIPEGDYNTDEGDDDNDGGVMHSSTATMTGMTPVMIMNRSMPPLKTTGMTPGMIMNCSMPPLKMETVEVKLQLKMVM